MSVSEAQHLESTLAHLRTSDTLGGRDGPVRIRSPHPYLRSQHELQGSVAVTSRQPRSPLEDARISPASGGQVTPQSNGYFRHGSVTPSESSSTEGEDEAHHVLKALPPPKLKSRKGLRGGDVSESTTPLVTPAPLDDTHSEVDGYFASKREGTGTDADQEAGPREAWERFHRQRRAELTRRACELLWLCTLGFLVFIGPGVPDLARRGFLLTVSIVLMLFLLYPLRLLLHPLLSMYEARLGSVRIPSQFDPAPLFYPVFLPMLVGLSLVESYPSAALPNLVLGLSALPSHLVPGFENTNAYSSIHWLITCLPLLPSQTRLLDWLWQPKADLHVMPIWATSWNHPEILVLLFPLHRILLPALRYLVSTSILPAELQLLSISLINLLLFSASPQARILSAILWIGGVGLFVSCSSVLRWNVELERIPRKNFRRIGNVTVAISNMASYLRQDKNWSEAVESSQTDDGIARADYALLEKRRRRYSQGRASQGSEDANAFGHRRNFSMSLQTHLSMTTFQAETMKWLYAAWTYAIVAALILGPIRLVIRTKALGEHEPFGWAFGYLFADLPGTPALVKTMHLEGWAILPRPASQGPAPSTAASALCKLLGEANTRLALFAYWGTTIFGGLGLVLSPLAANFEVDTRRKVFHGMMVAMLLPTTFIDPCFLSLGLGIVLAVFLLLDLFRAAQLKPLSKAIARFLTPYVDGRDLRGPVVVSHVFLLIGCAIPLWLALAGVDRHTSIEPWDNWEAATRDVSMVAGVVCVGMGDAAASLVGRRFGRHKWPWKGGKSLEGSAAFAVAVTVGLSSARAWLVLGGWKRSAYGAPTLSAGSVVWKAALAGSGASFTEAVLTGCNDNVVVPVVLWLLVRGLGL